MKNKLILPVSLLVLTLIGLSSCKVHSHSFGTEWEKDSTHHWHVCTDEDCSEISGKAEHTGGTATETEKAKCEVCGESYGSLKAHEHAYTVSKVDAKYLVSEADCDSKAVYKKSCACGEAGTETFESGEALGHNVSKVEAKDASILMNGNVEHYACSRCNETFEDAEAKTKMENSTISLWDNLADIESGSEVVADGSAKLVGLNSSSYVDDFFVDTNGKEIVGLYDEATANNQFTLEAEFTSNGSFAMILFANEDTTSVYTSSQIDFSVAPKLGFYIRFDALDAENNVKIQAALGNGEEGKKAAQTGIQASAKSTSLSFDGTTKNNIKVTIERYSVDKAILEISINNEKLSFLKVDNGTVDVCGFNFRTAWDRTKIYNDEGIGKSYYKNEVAYPTIALSRGLGELEGYGKGLAIAPIGYVERTEDDVASGKVAADSNEDVVVVVSKLGLTKTADTSTIHYHVYNQEVVHADYLVSAADCENAAVYNKSCSCGLEGTETFVSGDPLGHDLKLESDEEKHWYECQRTGCDHTEGEQVHSYEEGQYLVSTKGNGGHYQVCKVCGEDTEVVAHSGGTATETEKAKCEYCNEPYGSLAAHQCVFDQENTDEKYEYAAADCENAAVYYYSCECGLMGEETFVYGTPLGHEISKVEDKETSALQDGNIEHYLCSRCNETYSDEEGTTKVTVSPISSWKNVKDVTEGSLPVANGTATFTGLNSSAYIENIFVDENGKEFVGAYDAETANNEFTLEVEVASNGSFVIVLFANEDTTAVYTTASIVDNVAPKAGFYIRFDALDAEKNVKIQAALGNGTASKPAKTNYKATAKAAALSFDGITKNNIKVTIERYSVDKAIVEIYVNDEKMIFTKTNDQAVDNCGFNFRTAWDRTKIYNDEGIGDSYYKTSKSYPTIALSRGLGELEGFGKGLAIAPVGYIERVDDDVASGKVAADSNEDVVVVVSKLGLTKTADTSTIHYHVYNQEVVHEDYLVSEANCENSAVYNKSCSCGLEGTETFVSGEALGHDLKLESDEEKHWYECQRTGCDHSEGEQAHSYEEGQYLVSTEGEGGHYQVCKVCEEDTAVVAHSGGTATETEKAKCEHCGESYGELATHVCTYDQLIIDEQYLVPGSNCQTHAFYYKSCTCGEAGTESFDSDTFGAHDIEKVAAVAPTPFKDGSIEYYQCTVCGTKYSDENGTEVITDVSRKAWNALKDVETHVGPAINGTSATFSGVGSSSYISNIIVDANGNDIAGAYNADTANKEHTLSMNIVADETFVIVLFANEDTKKAYEDSDIVDNIAPNMGLYLTFDKSNEDVRIKAAVGNGSGSEALTGNKAKAPATFVYDGATVNTVSITIERFDESNLVLQIYINGELLVFTKTNSDGVKKCGFGLLKSWDGTTMGEVYSKSSNSYSPIVLPNLTTNTSPLNNGIAVAPVNAQGADTNATVVISNVEFKNTEVVA
ncbi:MAG: hypothetical protein E7177_01215 [Erysipelotrichaceae bacterium]|nr:hypothetical protein [Erysipelotrichaceae bacterium]